MNSQNQLTTMAMLKKAMVALRPLTMAECQMAMISRERLVKMTRSGRRSGTCRSQAMKWATQADIQNKTMSVISACCDRGISLKAVTIAGDFFSMSLPPSTRAEASRFRYILSHKHRGPVIM
jgi:hypothetical protein